jgi:Pvc16 N-terminal domain
LATWQLIEYTSRTLVRLIESHLAVAMPGHSVEVKLATPQSFGTLKAITKSIISVFLYRVSEHTELRNNPQRRFSDGSLRRQPLVLECSYLITTWGARGTDPAGNDAAAAMEEHKLLGIVLQGLYDHAEVSRAELYEDLTRPEVWGDRDGLQIVLETLPIEDLYRIWDSSELAYQLSATYRVRVLGLDSSEVLRDPPVVDAAFRVGRAT